MCTPSHGPAACSRPTPPHSPPHYTCRALAPSPAISLQSTACAPCRLPCTVDSCAPWVCRSHKSCGPGKKPLTFKQKLGRDLFTLEDWRTTRYSIANWTFKIFLEVTERDGVKPRDTPSMSSRGWGRHSPSLKYHVFLVSSSRSADHKLPSFFNVLLKMIAVNFTSFTSWTVRFLTFYFRSIIFLLQNPFLKVFFKTKTKFFKNDLTKY